MWKKILGTLLAGAVLTSPARAAAENAQYAKSELLVKWDGGPKGYAALLGNAVIGSEVQRNFTECGWQHVKLPSGMSVRQGMDAYQALGGVLAVEPNYTRRFAAIPNDPMFSAQWNLRLIGAPAAWETTTGSSDVVVAIIDTGVDYNHVDLKANLWRNPGETGMDANGHDKSTNGIDDDGNGYVDDVYGINAFDHNGDPMDAGFIRGGDPAVYHGTAIAGFIGAVGNNGIGLSGVNWKVQIMALRSRRDLDAVVFDANLIECFEYVIRMKKLGVNIRATNNSYGAAAVSQALKDAVDTAGREGILNVCAAGNNGSNDDQVAFYPGTFNSPSVLSVAASNASNELSSWSNYGRSTVHLAAPGEDLTTTDRGSIYTSGWTGTSYAAAHVTGAIALLAAADPNVTVDGLKAALLGSVDQSAGFKNKVISNGRLNVARALETLTNAHAPVIVLLAVPRNSRSTHDAPVEVTFSKPMDRTSVEAAFSLTPPIAGLFEWSDEDRTVTFVHNEPFVAAVYTGRILGSAMDLTGAALDGNFDRTLEDTPLDDFTWTFGFPVPNDDFANAQVISGSSGSLTASNRDSSTEFDEPDHAGSSLSSTTVWYRWTAEVSGWETFDTTPTTAFDTLLAVYSGSRLDSLTEIASNDNYRNQGSRVSLLVSEGTDFFIAVAGKSINAFKWNIDDTSMGQFVLDWYPTPPPEFTGIGFFPKRGPEGTKIGLSGINFTGALDVLFNGVSATFTINSDLSITATVPIDATTGPITVITPAGSVTSTSNFSVRRPFLRGDVNADGGIDLSDAVRILFYLFLGDPPALDCEAAADPDGSGDIDLTDAVYCLKFLFTGGSQPKSPFPGCGIDTAVNGLECKSYPLCK